jgi:capsule polysaccharide export protein KpsE/RkpR
MRDPSIHPSPRNSDAAILSEFFGIPMLVGRPDRRLALLSRYSEPWPGDPVFSLYPRSTIEGLVAHWRRRVPVKHDAATGLGEGRNLLIELDASARTDAAAQAAVGLDALRERLTAAREADMRTVSLVRRRVEGSRTARSDTPCRGDSTSDHSGLLAEYERLTSEQAFARETCRRAQAARGAAVAQAMRRDRHLAVYVQPARPETSGPHASGPDPGPRYAASRLRMNGHGARTCRHA